MDACMSRATYSISGDMDPSRMGLQLIRTFERKGTQLVLTESPTGGGPTARMTWERVPELEALPDYQRGAVGFWQWVSAGLFNAKDENVQPVQNRLVLRRLSGLADMFPTAAAR